MSLLDNDFDITKNDIVSIIIKYFLNNYYKSRLTVYDFEIDEHLYYYAGNKVLTQIEYDGVPENWTLMFVMKGDVVVFKLVKFGCNWWQCGVHFDYVYAYYNDKLLTHINLKMLFNIFNHEPVEL